MSPIDLIVLVGAAMLVARIVRRLAQPGSDLIEQGRRAMGDLAEGMRPQESHSLPEPRANPRPGNGPRPSVRPGNERPRVTRPGPATRSQRASYRPAPALDAWYLVLDVSPDATRREIQDALKLRLARARADRDADAMRRAIRAAGTGMGQPQRGRPD